MATKLSKVYANRKNKRVAGIIGMMAPSLSGYFNSLEIVKFNKKMEELPENGVVNNASAYLSDNNGNYIVFE